MNGSPFAPGLASRTPMPTRTARARGWPLLLAGLLPLAVFALQGRIGFGKSDEGFLWYGVQRVLAGEVPLRDFQAYDIGRYYWSAAWMRILGSDGLVALRFGNALLAGITVALATALARWPSDRRGGWSALAAVTFAVWMVPEYKAADAFATIALIAGLSCLIRDGAPRGAAAFGLSLGTAATVGINHALYGTIGGMLALGYLLWTGRHRIDVRTIGAFALATIAGYAPVLFCHVAVPGFSAAFVDAIRLLFEAGTTNVAIPVPSPLTVFAPGDQPFVGALRDSLFGCFYYAAPAFLVFCLWRLVAERRSQRADAPGQRANPVFVAAILLAIPYCHYVVSSAGTMHLAISGLPFLVAAWTFPVAADEPLRRLVLVALLPLSLFFLLHAYAGYPVLRGRPLEAVVVRGDTLRVSPAAAAEVRLVDRLTAAYPGRAFFAAHDWPGAYAVAGRRAPNWEIFEIFAALPYRQAAEIARIAAARPAFVILTTGRPGPQVDGLEQTHPDLLRYLRRCFVLRESVRDPLLTVDVLGEASDRCDAP